MPTTQMSSSQNAITSPSNSISMKILLSLFVSDIFQQSLAASENIRIGSREIAAVPRVVYILTGASGEFQQTVDFMLRVIGENVFQQAQVGTIHDKKQVILVIFRTGELPCMMHVAGNAVLGKLAAGRRVDG